MWHLTVDVLYMYCIFTVNLISIGFFWICKQVMVIPAKGYKNIGIPETMYMSVEKIIEQNKDLYRNPSEFIVDATRKLIREFKA